MKLKTKLNPIKTLFSPEGPYIAADIWDFKDHGPLLGAMYEAEGL